jgi:imidazolonepropionase
VNPDNFVVRGREVLTMPEHAPRLAEYDPTPMGLADRDAEITGLISDGGVWVSGGAVSWVGPWNDRPRGARNEALPLFETGVVTPGWIDCHTHSVFAGTRPDEYVLRNAGRPYVEILEAGGGILNTVDAVRSASRRSLTDSLRHRVMEFVRRGVTLVEVKSGYGLSTEDELKCLRAVRDAADGLPCELTGCFLGAHALPRNYRDRREDYVDLVCEEMIPRVAEEGLAAYCDVFCDRGAFTVDEARRVLQVGADHGLIPRIHADELTNAGAAALAAEIGAASADHLEFTPDDAIEAMGREGVVAVLMPAVNLFLRTWDHAAPARKLLEAGCELALATDFNPGSAMTQDLALMTTLGCSFYAITPGEALRGITVGAAKALRRDDVGRIEAGLRANLVCLDVPGHRAIPYHFGHNHVEAVVHDGEFVFWTEAADGPV